MKNNTSFQTYSLFLELIARPMWSALTSWFSAIFLLTAAIFVALISQVILVSAGSNYMLFTVGLLLFSIAVSGFSRSVFFRFKFIKKTFQFQRCDVDNSRRPWKVPHRNSTRIAHFCHIKYRKGLLNRFLSYLSIFWFSFILFGSFNNQMLIKPLN